MELLTGGREAFPQHVEPFPDLTAMIESTDDMMMGDHRPNLPPQKLRPIRYNGRSPASSQAEDPLEFVEAVELVSDDVCAVNGKSFDYLIPPIKAEVSDVIGTVGGGGGGLEEPPSSEQREEPSGVTNGFPLRIQVEKVVEKEVEINHDFLRNIFPKIDSMLHESWELHLEEGALLCPETVRKFQVNKGIPNMLLLEDEV
ncbi:hypothetical protein F3Y22_tig00111036pilonHSYRG00012 [Hibiscus syriacus]|uniref:Uncharacterized protein n=1 Tax=Hibiscus syriacus TaxID=106335 RepID=A0A6A2Z3W1_HIBSY|nr:hypothetical protein F3Y22_tig00111036pilonHSYRG00012 [Hibiscus syriacus]